MTALVLVPVSALEHWSYCPRQCGLIHLGAVWDENLYTIRGTHLHERADEPITRNERGVRVERALPIWSDELGLVGKADVVEFRPNAVNPYGKVVPVEYKSGGPQQHKHAELQLCAQALCLESMLNVQVPAGALYFAKTKERVPVLLTPELRDATRTMIHRIRAMLEGTALPPPANDRRCPRCSLIDACLPATVVAAQGRPSHPLRLRAEVDLP